MPIFARRYVVIRMISTVIAVSILAANFYLWGFDLDKVDEFPKYIVDRALIYGFQTFLFSYLGFMLADSVARFWWHRWVPRESNLVHQEQVKLVFDNGHLTRGTVYSLAQDQDKQDDKTPLVIISYGLNDDQSRSSHFAQALAVAGFSVLTWDYRGKGKTRGRVTDVKSHIQDLRGIIQACKESLGFGFSDIFLCGWSLGGVVSLIAGFTNPLVKKIFVWSTWSDLRNRVLFNLYINPFAFLRYLLKGQLLFPDSQENKLISPVHYFAKVKADMNDDSTFFTLARKKIFLCHARDDHTVPLANFLQNVDFLELPPENWRAFDKGTHLMIRKETMLLGLMTKFFTMMDQMIGENEKVAEVD